jgi:hypothetical protein
MAYEVGKLQIERTLAGRVLQQGDKFNLRELHDFVRSNGNVPLWLQRWELLGSRTWPNWQNEAQRLFSPRSLAHNPARGMGDSPAAGC